MVTARTIHNKAKLFKLTANTLHGTVKRVKINYNGCRYCQMDQIRFKEHSDLKIWALAQHYWEHNYTFDI